MRTIGQGCQRWVVQLFAVCAWAPWAQAATYVVTSSSDPSSGASTNCPTSPATSTSCTLRDALAAATSGSDTIQFNFGTPSPPSTTITLASTLVLSQSVTIDATGQTVAIDGNHAVLVFSVNAGVTAQIINLTIQNGSNLSGNGNGAGYGGGIYNIGTLTLTNSTLSGNSALVGGAICNNALLTLANSTLSGNSGAYYGGGIYALGPATLINSTLSGNSSTDGGGIYNNNTLTLTNSLLSGNSAPRGGGIENIGGRVTLTNSTLSGNSAGVAGGGIASYLGTVTLTNSTLSGNSALHGGAITNEDTVTLTNSTLSDNSASVAGGGIDNEMGTVTLTNSTLSGNSASTGSGIENVGTASLTNTIIADGCHGATIDNGGNIDSDGSCMLGSDSQSNVSASTLNLGGLANNGGPAQTVMPGAGSAAIDSIACTNAPATDQRGVTRPQGAKCDVGAVEVRQGTYTLTVNVTGGGSVSGSPTPSGAGSSGGITNCTSSGCSATYAGENNPSTITLIATPAVGYFFAGWGGACTAVPSTPTQATVTMSATQTCTASFTAYTTTTTLISSGNPSIYGKSVTFTATVAAAAPATATPTGTVTFLDGSNTIGNGTLSGGVATFSSSTLAVGTHPITARYGGDTNYLGASQPVSNSVTQIVSKDATTLTLTATPNPSVLGNLVTITATVTGDPPTGTVTFCDGATTTSANCPGTTLCSAVTLTVGTNSSTAVCTTTFTSIGNHTLGAYYGGDSSFSATAATLVVVESVNPLPLPAPLLNRWVLWMLASLLAGVGIHGARGPLRK